MEVRIIATVAILCLASGCTMMSLERHTVAQVDTTTELRYREVMNNLAMIAKVISIPALTPEEGQGTICPKATV